MKLIVQMLMLQGLVLGVLVSSAYSECALNCGPTEIPDMARCLCTPRLNCSTQPVDRMSKCHNTTEMCNNQEKANKCPEKCFCSEPSVLNKYCPTCLNGGMRDYLVTDRCQCKCFNGYQGSRCQYMHDPCQATDEATCSMTDCYNATVEKFFKCQRKCLCCKNKTCHNFGSVKADCSCECLKINGVTLYDASTDCRERIPDTCVDDSKCLGHFRVHTYDTTNCKFDFVKTLCPKTCGSC